MLLLAINICFHHVLTKKKCWHLLLSEKKVWHKGNGSSDSAADMLIFFSVKSLFWFLAWIIKRIVMKTYCCIKESERSFLTLEKKDSFSPLSTFFSPYLKVFLWYQKRRRPPSFMSSFHRSRCTILPLGLLDGCHPIENTFFTGRPA